MHYNSFKNCTELKVVNVLFDYDSNEFRGMPVKKIYRAPFLPRETVRKKKMPRSFAIIKQLIPLLQLITK